MDITDRTSPAYMEYGSTTSQYESAISSASRGKINQMIQNYFTKAVQIVVQSRVNVSPIYLQNSTSKKKNKWFNIELDDSNIFRDEVRLWKTSDALEPGPPPLLVEAYLDARDLNPNETLLFSGENEPPTKIDLRVHSDQIVLERWRIELLPPIAESPPDLPVSYKRTIVMFRSLYTLCRLLPTWKLRKRFAKTKINSSSLKVRCRILQGSIESRGSGSPGHGLETPLIKDGQTSLGSHTFSKVETAAGRACDFRVDDSEAVLSSHFASLDAFYPRKNTLQQYKSQTSHPPSLPTPDKQSPPLLEQQMLAYGSLGTFHNRGVPTSSSPLTTLRAVEMESSSSLKSLNTARPVIGQFGDNMAVRRPSVSFVQPFKSPSLSASPSSVEVNASLTPFTRTSSTSSRPSPEHRSFSRTVSNEEPVLTHPPNSQMSRPAPLHRYSSSFGQRRSSSFTRTPFANQTEGARVHSSSPKAYVLNTEEQGPEDFVRMLDSRKPLGIFEDGGSESLGLFERNTSALSKFHQMKESHAVLGESITSSMVFQRTGSTPSTSSRHIAAVPGMVNENVAYSTSSSLGKPVSPHTPAVPSRLSSGLTIDDNRPSPSVRVAHRRVSDRSFDEPDDRLVATTAATTSPLDIPSPPRIYRARSSSFSEQHINVFDDASEEVRDQEFAHRRHSTSLGSSENVQVNLNELLGKEKISPKEEPSETTTSSASDRHANTQELRSQMFRGRFAVRGRGSTPPLPSTTWSAPAIHSERRVSSGSISALSRPSFNLGVDDDELLFAMSDMVVGQGSKKPGNEDSN